MSALLKYRFLILLIFSDPDSGSNFKLDNFHAGPSETFDPHYGVGGYDGDGDITRLDNLQAFQKYVLELTEEQGVHFVMADGVSTMILLYKNQPSIVSIPNLLEL